MLRARKHCVEGSAGAFSGVLHLCHILSLNPPRRRARWAQLLASYDCNIKYASGQTQQLSGCINITRAFLQLSGCLLNASINRLPMWLLLSLIVTRHTLYSCIGTAISCFPGCLRHTGPQLGSASGYFGGVDTCASCYAPILRT